MSQAMLSDNAVLVSSSTEREQSTQLRSLGVQQQRSKCLPPANQTILEEDDMRLSCVDFRRDDPPSMEEVFGYLGPEEMEKAFNTKRTIAQFLSTGELRVDLGSGTSSEKHNVLPTDLPVVDILNQTKLAALFEEGTVSAIRASHVWEHFTYPQAVKAMESIRCLLDPNHGVARIATPDAYHPGGEYNTHKLKADFPDGLFNAKYREASYPGHRALWSAHKMAAVASITGLHSRPVEWWDSNEVLPSQRSFCEQPYDESKSFSIGRSAHHDKRNRETPLSYTSLIVDVMPQKLIEQPWSPTGALGDN